MIGPVGVFRSLDPRLCLLLSLTAGVVLWRMPQQWLIISSVVLLFLYIAFAHESGEGVKLRSLICFVLIWGLLKAAFVLWDGFPIQAAFDVAVFLSLRLACLLILGMMTAVVMTPRRTGLALTWLLRPVARNNAWQGALAFGLMIGMIQEMRRTLSSLRQAQKIRHVRLSWKERLTVIPMALLRVMACTTWTRSMAVASRRLDRSEVWTQGLQWKQRDTLILLAYAASIVFLFV
jgi:biotin transport system permease protein